MPPKDKGYYVGDDSERARAAEQWRAAWIERFAERQRYTRKWINFAEIADWCSKEDQSIVPNKQNRAIAFDTLATDLLAGEFEEDGRSLVLFLHATVGVKRMKREWLRDAVDTIRRAARPVAIFTALLDAKARVRALARKAPLRPSPARFQPRGAEQANKYAQRTVVTAGAKTRGVLEAINQLWPQGVPKGLAAKDRNNVIRDQLKKNNS